MYFFFHSFHSHNSEMCTLEHCPSDHTCHTVPYVFAWPVYLQDRALKSPALGLAARGPFVPLAYILTHQLTVHGMPPAIPLTD